MLNTLRNHFLLLGYDFNIIKIKEGLYICFNGAYYTYSEPTPPEHIQVFPIKHLYLSEISNISFLPELPYKEIEVLRISSSNFGNFENIEHIMLSGLESIRINQHHNSIDLKHLNCVNLQSCELFSTPFYSDALQKCNFPNLKRLYVDIISRDSLLNCNFILDELHIYLEGAYSIDTAFKIKRDFPNIKIAVGHIWYVK